MYRFLFLLLIFSPALCLAQYKKGSNKIIIGHNEKDINKVVKMLLIDNNYSINYIDNDVIQTDFKQLEYCKVRLNIVLTDSVAVFRGNCLANIGAGFEFVNTFGNGMANSGFKEMEEMAAKLYIMYNKEFIVE